MIAEGYAVDADLIACSSPYLTAHRNRFGRYDLNREKGAGTTRKHPRIQNAPTRGAEPRTFALDPSARILVAANQTAIFTGSSTRATMIPTSLAVFRVRNDGKLDFVRKYEVDTSEGTLFWMGIVPLP